MEAPISDSELEGSSEENEEHEGSDSESEEEEEEDKTSPATPPVSKKPSAPKKPEITQTPARPLSSSSDESGSESDSESDSPPGRPRRADPNIKPIASKPMEDGKKPRSKPTAPTSPPVKPSAAAVKRPMESESNRDAKDPKKAKKKASEVDNGVPEANREKKTTADDSKKLLFQRLWSEDDEIAILKGMIEYTAKKGADPVADMNAFHDFIKESLHVDVSKTQLSDKVRRLKKKYENNASKGKKGNDRTFSKPHEQKAYELSKKIWGHEGNSVGAENSKVNDTAKKNLSRKSTKITASAKVDGLSSPVGQKEAPMAGAVHNAIPLRSIPFHKSIGDPSFEEEFIRDGLELIVGPKRTEMEEKWRKLRVQEVELYLKRVELVREQTKLVLEALKSYGH